jgi:hypothetical protein
MADFKVFSFNINVFCDLIGARNENLMSAIKMNESSLFLWVDVESALNKTLDSRLFIHQKDT